MKKAFCFLSAILLIMCCALPAAAAFGKAEIPELKMSMDMPDGWIVFNRTVAADDPNLALVGMDKAALEQLFKEKDIYLNAVDPNTGNEIIVTMVEDNNIKKAFDLNLASETDIKAASDEYEKTLEANNITLSDYTIYKHKQATFLDYDRYYTENGQKIYGKQYLTVINGQAIHIIFNSWSGQPMTNEETGLIKGSIDSVAFSEVLPRPFQWDGILGWCIKGAAFGLVVGVITWLVRKSKKKNAPLQAENNDRQPGE